jgi:release factor glutamine methyltransferase
LKTLPAPSPFPTLSMLQSQLAAPLALAGLPHPRRTARSLAALALGVADDMVFLTPDRPVTFSESKAAAALLHRYLAGEPLSRIRGEREFWSLPFRLSPATLDPRPDSETLIAAALHLLPDTHAPLHILDLGTGSGCLLLTLLSLYPQAWGTGIDRAEAAARTAADNARRLELLHPGLADRATFAVMDWATALQVPAHRRVHLVVTNPPYICTDVLATLDVTVRAHDPRLALDGGPDGLMAYRQIAPALSGLLHPDGVALLEIGFDQAVSVPTLLQNCGIHVTDVLNDPGGHPRIVVARTGAEH